MASFSQPPQVSFNLLPGMAHVNQDMFWKTLEDDDYCMQEIVPNLYLGNERAAGRVLGKGPSVLETQAEIFENLKSRGITHILCLTSEGKKYFSEDDFVYLVCQINDVADEVLDLKSGIEFIKTALATGSGILVHCSAGQSRSASMVIAYLMDRYGYTYEEALFFVQSKRACALPNDGFAKQLKGL